MKEKQSERERKEKDKQIAWIFLWDGAFCENIIFLSLEHRLEAK
jgi:hypothetical protein